MAILSALALCCVRSRLGLQKTMHMQIHRKHACSVRRKCACTHTHTFLINYWSCGRQIREENPRLARDSKILRVTMDNVYEVFTTPREQTGLQGIHFRFMPDMQQVSSEDS
eukprot:1160436-Pelagomonas_calceolata.AAC.17